MRQGYTVGTRRVARLMKEMNLLVSIKRACRTTKSLQGDKPWRNLLEDLDVCHPDQVWVADITSVRLKHRFVYVALLMDVFHSHDSRVAPQSTLDASADLAPLRASIATLEAHGVQISIVQRGRPWENRICGKTHPHAQGRRSSSQRLSGHP